MAAASEDDNHWPGYVDALTTMTMMLIFVMTILAVAIFGLSQNVSRNMVEKIAKAVNIDDIDTKESTDDLASRVVARLETQQRDTMLAQARPKAGPDSPDESETPETRLASTEQAAVDKPLPARVAGADALITVAFQKRATGLDAETSDKIKAAMTDGERLKKDIELRAFAEKSGAVSDSRRVAFYRLLNLRSQLIALGVPPDRIKARIEDAAGQETIDLVRISVARTG